MKNKLASCFEKIHGAPAEVFAQAPGRIEFIGNHTDYNAGFTMGAAIDKVVMVALSRRADRTLCFASIKTGEKVEISLDDIQKQKREYNWVNYPLGVFKFLLEAGLKADCGFNMLDISSLPAGAGLSSSAAIELSSAFAFCGLYGFDCGLKTKVRIGRKCENEFVGMPCGILDQGVSGYGRKDGLVFIDCKTEEFSNAPLPHNCKFWLFNSTKKHALVDGMYAARHSECMEAAKALSGGGQFKFLREFSPEMLEAKKSEMSESAYKRAKHVIEENARVLRARDALAGGDIAEVGRLLVASHRSSQKLFENSCEELDFLVDEIIKNKNVFGARLSGGGFGGAVMALANENFSQADAEKIEAAYCAKFGNKPAVFTCSAGDGAKLA